MSTRNTGCDDPSRPRPPHHFHFPPVQLSPPTLNPWPVSPLTTTDVNYTPIMYTSSANFFKALTGTTGEPNYTLQTPVMSPPPAAPRPRAGCSDSVAALAINSLQATCPTLAIRFSLCCAVWSCHRLGRRSEAVSARSRATDVVSLRYEEMKCWFRIWLNYLCLYFSLYDLTLYVNLWLM